MCVPTYYTIYQILEAKEKVGLDAVCWIYYVLVEFLALYAYLVIGLCSGHSGSDEDDEEMDVDAAKEAGEVAQALEVADALGRTSNIAKSKASFDNIGDGLRELDMENYDEEDDGMNPICLSS